MSLRAATRPIGSLVLAALLLTTVQAWASSPFVIALPNGYYIQRDRAANPGIVKRSGRTVLQGPVAAYAVYRNIVIGCVGTWPARPSGYPNESPFPGSPDAEYFILDTQSGRLESGLDEGAWKQRRAELGVPATLPITAPLLPKPEGD